MNEEAMLAARAADYSARAERFDLAAEANIVQAADTEDGVDARWHQRVANKQAAYADTLREFAAGHEAAIASRQGRGRPAKADEHKRKHTGVYLSDAERAAVEAVLQPGEDFSAAMREAARLLIAARS